MTDPYGATDTQTVTINIIGASEDGSNDTPVITVATDVSETLAETEGLLSTTGSFNVRDVDITDVVSITGVTVATSGNDTDLALPGNATLLGMFSPQSGVVIGNTTTTGTVNWTFNGGTDAFDYLAVGESLTLTYTVTLADDNASSHPGRDDHGDRHQRRAGDRGRDGRVGDAAPRRRARCRRRARSSSAMSTRRTLCRSPA